MSRRSAKSTAEKDDLSERLTSYLSTITKSDKDLLNKYLDFVQSAPTMHDRDTLMRFLDPDAAPKRGPVSSILPLDELQERLDRIAAIEGKLRQLMPATWEPSISLFASLLLTPIQHLRDLDSNPVSAIESLDADNYQIPQLVQIFMAASTVVTESHEIASTTNSVATGSKGKRRASSNHSGASKRKKTQDDNYEPDRRVDSDGNAERLKKLSNERKKLDHWKCAILGTREPAVCHIVPFSSCRTPEKLKAFSRGLRHSIRLLLGPEPDVTTLSNFTTDTGVSDKSWNIFSMNHQLHSWWGKAYLGFKYLGILPGLPDEVVSYVQVQFFWMPQMLRLWKEDERDEEQLRTHLTNDRSPLVEQGIAAFHLSGRPLSTGDIFNIPVKSADAEKMKMAFEIQWALIRIAALTGGADVDEAWIGDDDDDDSPPEEEISPFSVSSWLAEVEPKLPDDNADIVVPRGSGQQQLPLRTIQPAPVPVAVAPEVKGRVHPPSQGMDKKENYRL